MSRVRATALLAILVAAGAAAAPAGAADFCVDVDRAGCSPEPSVTAALGAAATGDRVLIGARTYEGPFTVDPGVTLLGRGAGATRVTASSTPALTVAGRAEALAVAGDVRTEPGAGGGIASLGRLAVTGTVRATGPSALDTTAITAPAGAVAALTAQCTAVSGRGLTLLGQADHAVAAGCATARTASVAVRSSVLLGADPAVRTGQGAAGGAAPATVTTAWSAHLPDADVTSSDRIDATGVGADGVPGPGSPLLDRGDPAPLAAPDQDTGAPGEPFADLLGVARMADGDGDGTVRRDVGAREYAPPAAADPAGNVLANPGAEAGDPMGAGTPPGWSGTFGVASYGDDDLPGSAAGDALGGGARLFAGAAAAPGQLLQRISLAGSGAGVDAGTATASLSGLLGGYGADEDAISVTAAFRDPEGNELGRLALGPVTPAERGNDTTLVTRAAAGSIPARARAIDVTIQGDRVAGGYTDAYADRLALVLSVPGVPVGGDVRPDTPITPGLKPFAGVSVLTGAPRFSRTGRAKVQVACASGTVGACRGTLELRASLTGGRAPRRIGRYARFEVGPGRIRVVPLRLLTASRIALRRRSRLKARIVTTAADAQGVQRRRVVPVRLSLPATRTAERHRRARTRPTR